MRSPSVITTGSEPLLTTSKPTSSRYLASIVPGELIKVRPTLKLKPDLGRTCISYPFGIQTNKPVGIIARDLGSRIKDFNGLTSFLNRNWQSPFVFSGSSEVILLKSTLTSQPASHSSVYSGRVFLEMLTTSTSVIALRNSSLYFFIFY